MEVASLLQFPAATGVTINQIYPTTPAGLYYQKQFVITSKSNRLRLEDPLLSPGFV
jgi:hypothetical protein